MQSLRKLYKLGSKGETRVWWIDVDGDSYRTVSGILDGNLVESAWKAAKPKNVGRSNETTAEQQALLEAESKYENKQSHEKYTDDLSKVEETSEGGYFEPMLADKWDDDKGSLKGKKYAEKAFAAGKRVFVQPKLDGYRCVGQTTGLHTRNGETYKTVPHISEAIKTFVGMGYVIDGELYNHKYHDNFNAIQKLIAPSATPTLERIEKTAGIVQYHIYDMFDLNTPDALFSERHSRIEAMIWNLNDPRLVPVPTKEVFSTDEVIDAYGMFLDLGYEGAIVRIDAPYQNKRTKDLLKVKPESDEEYTILEVLEGEGNWQNKAKMVTCETRQGKRFNATLKGTMEENAKILLEKEKVVGLTCTVVFPNKTPDGIPRFPRVKEIWWDGKRSM